MWCILVPVTVRLLFAHLPCRRRPGATVVLVYLSLLLASCGDGPRKLGGGYSSGVELAADDLNGDGTIEVVTALNYHSELNPTDPELAI
jgi:hypothetical protein